MTLRHSLLVSGAAGGVTSPQDARLAFAGLLSGPGVLNGGSVSGSSSGPNMKYLVHAGVFVTQRGALASDGLYPLANDGTVTVDSGSPAPSSGTRWDLVYVLQPNAFGSDGFGDADSNPVFGVTVGTAGSSPTKPYGSVPAGALVLAESNVGTNIANASLATISNVAAQSWTTEGPTGSKLASGDDTPGSPQPMTTSGQYYSIYTAAAVFTLATSRRVRMYTAIQFTATSATSAHYLAKCAYNSGSTPVIGTATTPGRATSWQGATTQTQTVTAETDVFLTAGTYVMIPALQRGSGSSSTDAIVGAYCVVYDAGPN